MNLLEKIERLKNKEEMNVGGDSASSSPPSTQADTSAPKPAAVDPFTAAEKAAAIRLSFVQPCPACGCRYFRFVSETGFHCAGCFPHHPGRPIYAAGSGQGGAQRSGPRFISSETDIAATGQDDPADDHDRPSPAAIAADRTDRGELSRFKAGFPWVREHLQHLLSLGWTRAELFRRSRHRWPLGPWGLAWLFPVDQPGLTIEIGTGGEVVFTYPSNGRTIKQAVYPLKATTKPSDRA